MAQKLPNSSMLFTSLTKKVRQQFLSKSNAFGILHHLRKVAEIERNRPNLVALTRSSSYLPTISSLSNYKVQFRDKGRE